MQPGFVETRVGKLVAGGWQSSRLSTRHAAPAPLGGVCPWEARPGPGQAEAHAPGDRVVGTWLWAHLEQELQGSMQDAHPPPEENEEGHQELQDVVAERLKAMHPPWAVVQEVGHGVGHRLRLWTGRAVSHARTPLPGFPTPAAQEALVGTILAGGVQWGRQLTCCHDLSRRDGVLGPCLGILLLEGFL